MADTPKATPESALKERMKEAEREVGAWLEILDAKDETRKLHMARLTQLIMRRQLILLEPHTSNNPFDLEREIAKELKRAVG